MTGKQTESDVLHLETAIERGEKAALPFATLAISAFPSMQKKVAELYVRDKYPAPSNPSPIRKLPRHNRIRIGYFSSDFYNHATSYLMAELFERHDRSKFEIVGLSFGPDISDDMSRRVSAAMDRFLNVRSMPDCDIAQLSRELEIDIAVDLKGFTQDHRVGIFSHRAAPIQVNFVGYPGTMAANYIDYLIADPTLIPESSRRHYSEKIIYLPDSYQPNDSHRLISEKQPTRAEEGLPESAFVFCCFNNTYKITPDVFDIWMRILARVDNSVLWLLDTDSATRANLRKEAARRNISSDSQARLIFARPLPLGEHLARHTLADLFLDTAPYNAHTTASDALWTGLPVVTCIGDTFASRVAASLLRAVDLPDRHSHRIRVRGTCRLPRARAGPPSGPPPVPASSTRHRPPLRHRCLHPQPRSRLYCHFQRYHANLPPDHIYIPPFPNSVPSITDPPRESAPSSATPGTTPHPPPTLPPRPGGSGEMSP